MAGFRSDILTALRKSVGLQDYLGVFWGCCATIQKITSELFKAQTSGISKGSHPVMVKEPLCEYHLSLLMRCPECCDAPHQPWEQPPEQEFQFFWHTLSLRVTLLYLKCLPFNTFSKLAQETVISQGRSCFKHAVSLCSLEVMSISSEC